MNIITHSVNDKRHVPERVKTISSPPRTEPTVAVTYDTHAPAGSTQEVLYLARVGQRALVQLSDGDRHPVGLPSETIPSVVSFVYYLRVVLRNGFRSVPQGRPDAEC